MKLLILILILFLPVAAACRQSHAQPEEQPGTRPPDKPRLSKCGGDRTTTAIVKGTSHEHHVAAPNHIRTRWPWTPDRNKACGRDYCVDGEFPGLYFTHHGATATIQWRTRCVRNLEAASPPCVAEIYAHDIVPGTAQAFHDPPGESQHWEVDLVPDWGFGCTFTGTAPNIELQYRCNTSWSVEKQARRDHIAYALAYSSNHSSNIPVGASVGVVVGPVFAAASYSPQFGSGTYGASRLWESQMGCELTASVEGEATIIDTYTPIYLSTIERSSNSFNEIGAFPMPEIQ
jgi:hypothetical protein